MVCCRGAWVACVGVRGPPAAWRAAAALALAVVLGRRSAGRGGSEEEMGDVDEEEDEEEVVVSRDAGCATMWAGAALWAVAASAAATAGRTEGMSSDRGLEAGGWGGRAVTSQPGGPIRSAAVGAEGSGLRSPPSGLGWEELLQCVRAYGLASAGGKQFVWAAFGGRGGWEWGSGGVCGGCVRITWWGACAVGHGAPRGGRVRVAGLWGVEGCSGGGSVAGVCCCLRGEGGPCCGARGCA